MRGIYQHCAEKVSRLTIWRWIFCAGTEKAWKTVRILELINPGNGESFCRDFLQQAVIDLYVITRSNR
jgi:hypothetical protein